MTSATLKDVMAAVPNLAQANRKVLSVVQDLASKADGVQDEAARALILNAAQELLGATNQINETLESVAGSASSKRP